MKVTSATQKTVVFLGYKDNTKPGGIYCIGTGFLFHYKDNGYLVTVAHVAKQLEDVPFCVRVNRNKTATLLETDNVKWFFHPDETVDVAAIPFHFTPAQGFSADDIQYIFDESALLPAEQEKIGIDIGDLCYTIGLFPHVYGTQLNMPLLYSGNIALFPPKDERIPVTDESTGKTVMAEVFLIETHSLQGASGSPVFARNSKRSNSFGKDFEPLLPEGRIRLLGIFQGAWFAPPNETLEEALRTKGKITVPLGLGVVTPIEKLFEILEIEQAVTHRKAMKQFTTK